MEGFINSDKRIVAGTTEQDFMMLRRYEFERLIEYWEQINPELTLLAEKRTSMLDEGTQTIHQQINVSSSTFGMQT